MIYPPGGSKTPFLEFFQIALERQKHQLNSDVFVAENTL